MSVFHENMLIGASGQVAAATGISRSLRFNSSDSAYCSRVPASAGNRKTWTWAGWVKRSALGAAYKMIFSAGTVSNECSLRFTNSPADTLEFYQYTGSGFNWQLTTTQVFRDPSAWYHIVAVVDSTQGTASNRAKLYINGVQVTAFNTASYPSPNFDSLVSSTTEHGIGRVSASQYFDGLLADIHFIDGGTPATAVDSTGTVTGIPGATYLLDFGEFDATTGVWVPKAYTGSYNVGSGAVNGFHLEFADNSSNTATTLGKDTSGLGNNWNIFNISTATGGPTSVAAASGALPIYNTTDTYGATKGTGTRTDANASSLVLAIPMDGANNGTTFTDESATIKGSGSAKAITRTNTVTSTSQSKFYGSSGYFNGNSYLSLASSTDFGFGTSDVTIEFWLYPATLSGVQMCLDFRSGGTGPAIYTNGSSLQVASNTSTNIFSSTPTLSINQWQHIVFARISGTAYLYVNGLFSSSAANTTDYGSSDSLYVGLDTAGASQYLAGYIQDVRVYKGVAKYTSNFNPPTSTVIGSVAAGNDSLVDVPTNGAQTDTGVGGEVRGNYCTLNPLNTYSSITLSNGNLDYSHGSSGGLTVGTIGVSTGKWYWEHVASTSYTLIGLYQSGSLSMGFVGASGVSLGFTSGGFVATSGGPTYVNSVSYGTSDVIGFALNMDAGTLTIYKNGSATSLVFSGLTGTWFPAEGANSTSSGVFNFGARSFAYTAPSGFKALNTANLPAPLVTKPSTVMDVKLWTGNGSTQNVTGLSFSPDLVFIHNRTQASNWVWFDTIRGALIRLISNLTNGEASLANSLTSFNSDGFTYGSEGSGNNLNDAFVGYCFDAGTTTSTNTAGSISGGAQVRANTSAGFSIVTWTGDGATEKTVGHGLGVAPKLYIVKRRNSTSNWAAFLTNMISGFSPQPYVNLNGTAAAAGASQPLPTSSVFYVQNVFDNINTATYVAYCFAPVVGYSNGFSYTGNGSTDGSFVYLGFRPRLILLKCSSTTGNWTLVDTAREGYNVDNDPLYPNLSDAEGTTDLLDITSNGFKLRTTDASVNSNAATYIGFAWAESPFNYARAR